MSEMPPQGPEPRSPSALTGVAWLLAFRVVDRLAGIVSFLILARLLLPEHFGVVALATAVIAFIEILTSLGAGHDPYPNTSVDARTLRYCVDNPAWNGCLLCRTDCRYIVPGIGIFSGAAALSQYCAY